MFAQRLNFAAQLTHFGFQCQHMANAFEVHTALHQLCDAMQECNIGLAVATATTLRACWTQQTNPFIISQRLWMHPRQLGRHRNHVHRHAVMLAVGLLAHTVSCLANASNASRCESVSSVGTVTSTVTIKSPAALTVVMPRPFTR